MLNFWGLIIICASPAVPVRHNYAAVPRMRRRHTVVGLCVCICVSVCMYLYVCNSRFSETATS